MANAQLPLPDEGGRAPEEAALDTELVPGRPRPKTEKAPVEKTDAWDGLQRHEVVSYWYKALRVGDPEGAWAALEVLRTRHKVGDQYALTRLIGLLMEDGSPEAVRDVLPAIAGMGTLYKAGLLDGGFLWHALAHATWLIATAPKWYMTAGGPEVELLRQRCKDDAAYEEHLGALRLPAWTHDEHTWQGKRRAAAGTADLRMSGTFESRPRILARWQAFVRERPGLSQDELRREWVREHYETAGFEPRKGHPGRKPGPGATALTDGDGHGLLDQAAEADEVVSLAEAADDAF
jgi:hypothetical protein